MRSLKFSLASFAAVVGTATLMFAVGCGQSSDTATEPTQAAEATSAPATTQASPSTTAAQAASDAPRGAYTPPRSIADEEIWSGSDEIVAKVRVEGSTLFYDGEIGRASYKRFVDVLAENGPSIRVISINSPGGDTEVGRWMGDWIFDNQIDLRVRKLCFSSCGNYLFTAAPNKIIERDSIVGWHGSDQQDRLLAEAEGIAYESYLRKIFDEGPDETPGGTDSDDMPDDLPSIDEYTFEDFKAQTEEAVADEKRFLTKIGVPADALLFGLTKEYQDTYGTGDYSGWTFTIEDMAKLGLNNITQEGGGAYPSEQARQEFFDIVVLEVAD